VRPRFASFRARVLLIGGVALGVRFAATWFGYRNLPLGLDDNNYYHLQGKLFAEYHDIIDPFIWNDYKLVTPGAGHPPLYPTYLGMVSMLGFDTPLGHRLASCLLGAIGVVLVGYVGRKLAGDRAGLIAAALAAVYPNLWINDGLILAESMVTATIALVLLAAYGWRDDPSPKWSAALGASIAVAGLARSETLFLCLLMVVPLVLLTRTISFKRQIQLGAITAAVAFVVVAPWIIRNTIKFDDPATMATGSGRVLAYANCDETYSGEYIGYWNDACTLTEFPGDRELRAARDAAAADPGDAELQQAYDDAIAHYVDTVDESVIDTAHREKAQAYIEDHWTELPPVVLARIGRMWDVYRPFQGVDFNVFFERRGLWPSRAALAMYWALLPFGAYGLVLMHRRKQTIIPFVAIAAMVTITAASTFGITRYRVPVEVCLVVLAGIALDALWGRWRGAREDPPSDARAPVTEERPASEVAAT
jgi:4-amino-4-deoxy-L-arabinose transferase-like glycosyltransferase